MLNRVTFPLTAAQVSDFILGKEYTNFLTLQQVINELTDAGMIATQSIRNRTHLSITAEGKETLNFFENRIGDTINKSTSGEYEAHLVAKDSGINLVDITLSVPVEETAAAICDNWQKKNQEIYKYLITELF